MLWMTNFVAQAMAVRCDPLTEHRARKLARAVAANRRGDLLAATEFIREVLATVPRHGPQN